MRATESLLGLINYRWYPYTFASPRSQEKQHYFCEMFINNICSNRFLVRQNVLQKLYKTMGRKRSLKNRAFCAAETSNTRLAHQDVEKKGGERWLEARWVRGEKKKIRARISNNTTGHALFFKPSRICFSDRDSPSALSPHAFFQTSGVAFVLMVPLSHSTSPL